MIIFFYVVIGILIVRLIVNYFSKRKLVKMFETESVLVSGGKGTGKDMMFSFVTRKRRLPYHSNVNYGGKFIPFNSRIDFSCGGNTCVNLINNNIIPYEYPYPDGQDYYISDAGVYYPAQDFALLNRNYRSYPLFSALSRHLGDCAIHLNVQNPNRVWDKLREQCTMYVRTRSCRVFFGRLVRLSYVVYTDYESCCRRIDPFKRPLFGGRKKLEFAHLKAAYGDVRGYTVWFLAHQYDDRVFKRILLGRAAGMSQDIPPVGPSDSAGHSAH